MIRLANSFGRKGSRFQPQPIVLVLCEDSHSGKKYLEDARVYFRVDALVKVAHPGKNDPRGIVEYALGKLALYDQIFCVFDRDTHENFHEAVNMASASNKIRLIISYPCFEYWLVLHFGLSRRTYASVGGLSAAKQMTAALKKFEGMEHYDKSVKSPVFRNLLPKLKEARKNARLALSVAEKDQNLDPSTKMHQLFDEFEGLSTPKSC